MKDLRRQRLIELLNGPRFNGVRSEFLKSSGLSKGRLAQLLDPDKQFGDTAAKNLCESLGLPVGYFEKQDLKQNHPLALTYQGQTAANNITDLASRRTIDSAEQALRVLADIIRPMSNAERDVVACNLRGFALDPDSLVAMSSLLAGLDAANARRRYDPPPNSTVSNGG